MKIKEINIENFGKLSGFHQVLNDGITSISRENGWGKSTLAGFIKVMFYGFDNERAKKNIEKERHQRMPWDGGTYGGSIVFEVDGKEYLLIRSFSDKANGDTFALYDNKTKLESRDYTDKIGEELFGLDAESFKKTVFIGQNDIETETSDQINAKVGNIAGVTDDLSDFEAVDGMFKDVLNSMSPRRQIGSISKLQNEITGLENEIRNMPAIDLQIGEKSENIKALNTELAEKKAEIQALVKEQNDSAKHAELLSKKEQYKGIEERYNAALLKQTAASSQFPKGTPSDEEIERNLSLVSLAEEKDAEFAALQFSELEKADYTRLSARFAGKEEIAENAGLVAAEIDEAKAKNESFVSREALLKTLEPQTSKLWLVLLILGLVLCGAGAAVAFSIDKTIGIILACGGAALAAAGILVKVLVVDSKYKRDFEAYSKQATAFVADKNAVKAAEDNAAQFLSAFGMDFSYSTAYANIIQIKNDFARFKELDAKDKDTRDDKLRAEIEEINAGLGRFMADYEGIALSENDMRSKLLKLRYEARNYAETEAAFRAAKHDKDVFEDNNNVSEILAAEANADIRSLQEIAADQEKSDAEREALINRIHAYDDELSGILEHRDELAEAEDKYEAKQLEIARQKKRYDLIQKTQELLNAAKTNFTAKYAKPVADGFRKYYELLEGGSADQYTFDANLNLKISDHGDFKDIRLYSAGSRDKINICFRMGLIEAMYKGEKPVLIMDDPFTNLDEKRLEGARKILKVLEKDYQIIYLTCHESREIC